MKQVHVFASYVDDVIDMLTMALNELLFFFENHFDEAFVVLADPISVIAILHLEFGVSLHRDIFKLGHLWWYHDNRCSSSSGWF
jgi:hypothetical protein